jgi:hypothetical protein
LRNAVQPDSGTEFSAGMRPGVYLAAFPSTLTSQEWKELFAAARSGGVVVCGALRPGDELAIQALSQAGINVKVHMGIGSWMGCYHWIPDSDLFAGLPSGGLALKPYAEIVPKYILSEMGGEVQAGSLRNTQSRQDGHPSMLWFSDIETLPFGEGAIVFCQYRVFENIDRDPLAKRLAYNFLCYAAETAAGKIVGA